MGGGGGYVPCIYVYFIIKVTTTFFNMGRVGRKILRN